MNTGWITEAKTRICGHCLRPVHNFSSGRALCGFCQGYLTRSISFRKCRFWERMEQHGFDEFQAVWEKNDSSMIGFIESFRKWLGGI